MGGFDVKSKTLPTVSTALLHAAIIVLEELYKERGPGIWVENLHQAIERHLKNQEHSDMGPVEEIEHVDAALTAVDALFSTVYNKYKN